MTTDDMKIIKKLKKERSMFLFVMQYENAKPHTSQKDKDYLISCLSACDHCRCLIHAYFNMQVIHPLNLSLRDELNNFAQYAKEIMESGSNNPYYSVLYCTLSEILA